MSMNAWIVNVRLLSLPYEVEISENECLFWIESHSDNVFDVLVGKSVGFVQRNVFPQEFLIVRQLDYQRHVENVLKIPKTGCD